MILHKNIDSIYESTSPQDAGPFNQFYKTFSNGYFCLTQPYCGEMGMWREKKLHITSKISICFNLTRQINITSSFNIDPRNERLRNNLIKSCFLSFIIIMIHYSFFHNNDYVTDCWETEFNCVCICAPNWDTKNGLWGTQTNLSIF